MCSIAGGSMYRIILGFILICACSVAAHGMSSEKRYSFARLQIARFLLILFRLLPGHRFIRDRVKPIWVPIAMVRAIAQSVSEYGLFVVTSPWSYFSALSIEWGTDGKFRGYIPEGFKEWITSKNGFNSELVTDRQHRFANARRAAERSGDPNFPARLQDWEMPQHLIPVDKRYRLAIETYKQRQFPNSMIAKVALTGAWAVRVQMNKPIFS